MIDIELIKAEKARRNLSEYTRQAWHVLEPQTPFFNNWHLDAISEHLMAVSSGEISKLIINVPPGHCKSLSVCVFWITWEWITKPHLRWLFASYGAHLSVRDSIKTRNLITSDWYQKNFGHVYQLEKTNEQLITNNKLGFRYATSVGGVGTGERVHRVVNDDLLNATDARSEAMREQANRHMESMATRAVPTEPFGQVLIMQRLDELDPTAWAQKQGGWEELILPAEFETTRRCRTSIGFVDPRQEEGELLWPELFPLEKLAEIKRALGPYGSAAQLQQRPAPVEGGIIKLEYLRKTYQTLPKLAYIIQSWDTAFKTGQNNDFSVCTTWGVGVDGNIYLLDRYKAKIEFPELKSMMLALYLKYKPATVLIEDKASGQSLIQEMLRPQTSLENPSIRFKIPIKPVKVDVDKEARANACTTTIETSMYLPEQAHWKDDYISNLTTFPNGAHDDDVDSTTQALIFLALRSGGKPPAMTNINVFGR